MRFLIFILCFIKLSSCVTLNCTFEYHNTVYDRKYSCMVKNFHTSFHDRKVKEVLGSHENGKTHADVKQIFFKHQNVPYLPLNVGEFFTKLESLYVMKSNVQHLLSGDLDGLDNLKIFDVSHNPVEHIGIDFFKGHSAIEKISFYDCHLKKVDKGAFDDLKNLEGIYFDQNPCVDVRGEASSQYGVIDDSIEEVIADIYDKCHGMNLSLRTNQTCHSILNEKIVQDVPQKSSSLWSTILTVMLVFTMVLNIIFGIMLVRIFKNNFGGSWHEMKSVLI